MQPRSLLDVSKNMQVFTLENIKLEFIDNIDFAKKPMSKPSSTKNDTADGEGWNFICLVSTA
jgi:hypothetical protein